MAAIAELKLNKLPTVTEHEIDYTAALIRVHHARGFTIEADDLNPELHEAKHLQNLTKDSDDNTKLEMNGNSIELLTNLPKELRYWLFVDYQVFHHLRETWVQYEKRELGCIKNFFDAVSLNVLSYLDTPPGSKSQIFLDDIKKLHATVVNTVAQIHAVKFWVIFL